MTVPAWRLVCVQLQFDELANPDSGYVSISLGLFDGAGLLQVGPDLMMTGFLPSSGGLSALEQALSFPGGRAAAAAAAGLGNSSGSQQQQQQHASQQLLQEQQSGALLLQEQQQQQQRNRADSQRVISFYKAWDEWGSLSNFSPHPIRMPAAAVGSSSSSSSNNNSSSLREYASVEHFYQSQKFAGVDHADAAALVESISAALSPEEAAQLGRRAEREQPELVRPDWANAKCSVMLAALRAKFSSHAGPRSMLLSTAGARSSSSSSSSVLEGAWGGLGGEGGAVLVESSPHDRYWGQGYDGSGQNHLGLLLMQVRQELLEQQQQQEQQQQGQQQQQQHHAVNGAWLQPSSDGSSSSSWARDLQQPLAG
jgi:diaminohydroxyphosphoribosylaminopyrimidine deaminase/5-amino-6-(5-phosphoribosylamino)uracil reductase